MIAWLALAVSLPPTEVVAWLALAVSVVNLALYFLKYRGDNARTFEEKRRQAVWLMAQLIERAKVEGEARDREVEWISANVYAEAAADLSSATDQREGALAFKARVESARSALLTDRNGSPASIERAMADLEDAARSIERDGEGVRATVQERMSAMRPRTAGRLSRR